MHNGSAAARAIGQWSVTADGDVSSVTSLDKGRQQIEQATLGAAELIELVQKQQAGAHCILSLA